MVRRKSIPMGECVMFTRNAVHPNFCVVCGYHEVVHTKKQNPGMDAPNLELPPFSLAEVSGHLAGSLTVDGVRATDMVAGKLRVDPKFPRGLTADRLYIPKEKKMVAYNQRNTTIKAHEYVLGNPAAAGDVQVAIRHAMEAKASAGLPVQTMDAVMVRGTDDEIIVYWEEEVKE